MCGIFGLYVDRNSQVDSSTCNNIIRKLFLLSESRGKEASGLSVKNGDTLITEKSAMKASDFIKTPSYKNIFKNIKIDEKKTNNTKIFIGHSRLVTNGTQYKAINNQPVESSNLLCVHNGIIVNHAKIWEKIGLDNKESDLDTEPFLKLIDSEFKRTGKMIPAIQDSFSSIEGAASVAFITKKENILHLATNTGSIYYINFSKEKMFIFASEERFLKKLIKCFSFLENEKIHNLEAATGIEINEKELLKFSVSLSQKKEKQENIIIYSSDNVPNEQSNFSDINNLKRCKKCILPETMPYIHFDLDGVCNYCHSYKSSQIKPMEELEKIIKNRKKRGKYDCLVAFSGGRDSCYGLHLIKKELGLNPLAMTYDWGVVTDIARRNQARMCGALGIEHILISSNISKKRDNIRKNLTAWLKQPKLGMIPLLMAGDKHFFYYSQKIAKENDIDLIIFNVNPLEKTDFKSGFLGIEKSDKVLFHDVSFKKKILLASYYLKNFLTEPSYLNSSLIDTAAAFLISYFMKHPYIELFDYFKWDEKIINDTLINNYNWEIDPTTPTTWRIGDGTAALYNYIYNHVAGFTENDTLRSNQIREGVLDREDALNIIGLENKPRYMAIREYLDSINMDFTSTMNKINDLKKMY